MTILTLSRRNILRGVPVLAGAAVLGACTTSTSGNVTTITLNVAKIKAYGQAGLNAAFMVETILSAVPATAPYAVIISAATGPLTTTLNAFSTALGSTVSFSYDDTNYKTLVDSILADLQTLGTDIANGLTAAGSSVSSQATTASAALNTVISIFEALLTSTSVSARLDAERLTMSAKPVAATGMTETQALSFLRVPAV